MMNTLTRSEKFWDRISHGYARKPIKDMDAFQQTIDRVKSYLDKDDTIIDLGCGTGSISNRLASSVSEIHAIDISSRMLDVARKRAAERNVQNIRHAHTTLYDERYQAGSIDAVVAFNVLHLFDDSHRLMRRINQLLVPGGLLISVTPCVGIGKSLINPLLWVLGKVGLMPTVHMLKPHELEILVHTEGFDVVECEPLAHQPGSIFLVAKKTRELP